MIDAIAGGIWVWENVVKEMFGDEIEEGIKAQWEKFGWKKAGERYLEKLYQEYSVVRPLGSPAPFPLEDIFTDVYIIRAANGFPAL